MKIRLKINEKDCGMVEIEDGMTGLELSRKFGAPPPVTLMKVNGRFVPLPERLKEHDDVVLIVTSSSG